MTPDEIMRGMKEKGRLLSDKNEELKRLSEEYAAKKRDYRVQLARGFVELKVEGHAATLIPVLARGDKDIAEMKYKMDVAEGVLNACRDSQRNIRELIGAYRSLLTWLRAEMTNNE